MIRLPFFTTASIVACIFAGAWAWKAEHPVLAAETWLQRDWTEEFVDSTGRPHTYPLCPDGVPYVTLRENGHETGCIRPDGSKRVVESSEGKN